MLRHFFNMKNIFLLLVVLVTFLVSLILTICKCIKKTIVTFAFATILLIIFIEKYYKQPRFNWENLYIYQKLSKIANQQPTKQTPPTTTSQGAPTPPTSSQTNQPQPSTCISFPANHALLSEPLIPAIGQAPLSETQYKSTYKSTRHCRKMLTEVDNQKLTSTIDKHIIHPRGNRNLATPKVHFDKLSLPSSLQTIFQQNTPNILSDYRFNTNIPANSWKSF